MCNKDLLMTSVLFPTRHTIHFVEHFSLPFHSLFEMSDFPFFMLMSSSCRQASICGSLSSPHTQSQEHLRLVSVTPGNYSRQTQ